MKILITNTVVLNGGDAAILCALINVLKEKFGANTEFVVFDQQPDIAKRYYVGIEFRRSLYLSVIDSLPRIRGIRYLRWLKLPPFYFAVWCWRKQLCSVARLILSKDTLQDIALYDSADLIVSTGGTYLVENYDIVPRIFDYKVSLLMDKALVFFTQSLGPFSKRRNRTALSNIFSRALLILLRDEKSREHLVDLGVKMCKVCVVPDVAFSLPAKEIPKKGTSEAFSRKQFLNIGISVRDWPFFEKVDKTAGMKTYLEVMGKAVIHLVNKYNANITFISTCQGIPEYWTDDSRIAMNIWSGLPDNIKKSVRVDQDFHTPSELLEISASFDMVIATRMHMAILSLVAGTPVLPIAYEFKTQELFNQLGLAAWTQDIEALETKTFLEVIDSFLEQFPENSKAVFHRVAQERERAMDSGKPVKEAYDNWLKRKQS